jgi:hypothetical protein
MNRGSGALSRRSAGATTIFRAICRPWPVARFSGTDNVPQ